MLILLYPASVYVLIVWECHNKESCQLCTSTSTAIEITMAAKNGLPRASRDLEDLVVSHKCSPENDFAGGSFEAPKQPNWIPSKFLKSMGCPPQRGCPLWSPEKKQTMGPPARVVLIMLCRPFAPARPRLSVENPSYQATTHLGDHRKTDV